ncbi:hypothetical protein LCGC14_1274170 [marine sediment metagenome]|uniref:Histidine kinase/HSP90-like ATPase domain-containing protein n=1 Tax=marine sediment metagenome TaxID=412755 RepID=A0A0F9KYV9_9ZZZZ
MSENKILEEGQILNIHPKMGVIPELTKQNYEGLAKQLREPVTNAVDAKAENIYIDIQADGKFTDLIISDDGEGMNDEIFLEQFLALGGSDKYDQEDMIGRIGIGFLACAPFCEEIEIHSRFKGTKRAFIAVLYSEKFYTESFRYEGMDEFEAGKVIKIYEDADVIGLDPHYTRIRLKRLSQEVINQLTDIESFNNLKDELRKILPLTFPANTELFNHVSPELKKAIRKYSDPWSVKIFFNGEELIRRTYGEKPNEKFKDINELIEVKAKRGSGKVTGYLIQSYSKLSSDWRCLISRYQNTTVEYSGYLRFKEKSSLQYITGELFLDGLDKKKAISINRNEFNEGDDNYLALRDVIHEILDNYSRGVYSKSRKSSEIRKVIKKKTLIKQKLNNVSKSVSKQKKKKQIQKEIIKKASAKKKPPVKKEGMVDECRDVLKGAGYTITKRASKKGGKPMVTKKKRQERTIIKERVEDTFKPILKDISGSKEKDEKYSVGFIFHYGSIPRIEIVYEYDKIKDAERKVHYLNGGE